MELNLHAPSLLSLVFSYLSVAVLKSVVIRAVANEEEQANGDKQRCNQRDKYRPHDGVIWMKAIKWETYFKIRQIITSRVDIELQHLRSFEQKWYLIHDFNTITALCRTWGRGWRGGGVVYH